MIEAGPESSTLIRIAAVTLLTLHISAGTIALLAGAGALIASKGGQTHRTIGNVFFIAMLIMASIGGLVAAFMPQPQWVSAVAGALTVYLIATARMTVQRPAHSVGRFERGALVMAIGLAITAPVAAAHTTSGTGPAGFLFAGLAAVAAVGDWRMLRHGGLSSRQRLARHLWRMCVALWIAAASFFLGQQQVMPEAIRGSVLLVLPPLAVLVTMIFWLMRLQRRSTFA